MRNNLAPLVLLLLLNLNTAAQKFEAPSKELLSRKESSIDPSAVATIIYHQCKAGYKDRPLELEIIHKKQIQIHTPEGESYADFNIPLYKTSSKREKIGFVRATSYYLEQDGSITKKKLSKKEMYKNEASDYLDEFRFALPNVKPGTIINVEYQITSPFLYAMPRHYFQHYIPTEYSEFRIDVPQYFSFTPIATGLLPLDTKKTRSGYKIVAQNLPASIEDDYVLNSNDYRSSIKYELQSVDLPGTVPQKFSKDWPTIGENLYKEDGFGKQMNNTIKELEYLVQEAQSKTYDEKLKFIYEFVRTNYSMEEYGSIYKNATKKLLKSNTGSVRDINMLMINLLRKVDIEATPLLTRVRSQGLLNPSYPTLTNLSYVLAHVVTSEGKTLLLDATSKDHPLGCLPYRAINFSGLLIKADGKSEIITIENPNIYKTTKQVAFEFSEDLSSIKGEGITRLSDLAAISYCQDQKENESDDNQSFYYTTDEVDAELEEEEEDDFENVMEINSIENVKDIYKDIDIKYESESFDLFKKLGNEIFIEADLNEGLSENPWKEENRIYPIFFNKKGNLSRSLTLEIPDGWQISSLPEPITLSGQDKITRFVYSAAVDKNTIRITYLLSVRQSIILPTQYASFKKFLDMVIEKQDEKIILSRI